MKEIRPDLIYCAISGFGQDGPASGNPAYDQIVQGLSGAMDVTGDANSGPLRTGFPVADTIGGMTAAACLLRAGFDVAVFEQDGDHFHRVGVHVLYQDKDAVVIENDGSLTGATLAMSGAYQMQLAIKNKLGGGVDLHAGHSH